MGARIAYWQWGVANIYLTIKYARGNSILSRIDITWRRAAKSNSDQFLANPIKRDFLLPASSAGASSSLCGH